jgi:hypothetical protein
VLQDAPVSLLKSLELFFGPGPFQGGSLGEPVGMPLLGQIPVGALDRLVGRAGLQAQEPVVLGGGGLGSGRRSHGDVLEQGWIGKSVPESIAFGTFWFKTLPRLPDKKDEVVSENVS